MNKTLKLSTFALSLLFVFSLVFSNIAAAFTGSGAGTEGNPYQITTCEELQEMNDELDAHYILMNDIDCLDTENWNAGEGFVPVGNFTDFPINLFTGTFDGNNHTISDLFINLDANHVGLFGYASDVAEIRNVGLVNADVTGNLSVGGLVGLLEGTVENAYVTGAVEGWGGLGGLVGRNRGDIIDSHSTASVTNNSTGGGTGGLVGYMIDGASPTIVRSYATGAVISTSDTGSVGGLLGEHQVGPITDSYATGNVEGTSYVGGLVGYSYGSTISNSYATGSVIGSDARVGGFIGTNDGSEISGSYALGNVTGQRVAGGFVGANTESPGVITDSYARGSVTGLGSFGNNSGIGGFAGRSPGIISRSFSTGAVNGGDNQNVGGFVGSLGNEPGTVDDSFWNTETSGQATSAGGTGKTTVEMKEITTFSGATWDIELSETDLNDGYPFLSWQAGDSTPVWYILESSEGETDPNAGNDKNGDGIPDDEQPHVSSLTSSLTGKTVVLEVDDGCEIDTVSVAAESTNSVQDPGYDYPAGLMNFTVDCGTPGYTTDVTQYYYDTADEGFEVRKHNPNTNAYFNIPDATIGQTTIYGQQVLTVTYQVTDGGDLDIDDEANGIIVDPVGLALSAVGVPNTGLGGNQVR